MSKLWGGRFSSRGMDPDVLKFTSSIGVDKALAKHDCIATKVHVEMLAKCGYITEDDKKKLAEALDELLGKIEEGSFKLEGNHEDIHSAIHSFVEGKLPEEAKKMHTGRSRNEQIVNSVRLYCKEKVLLVKELIKLFQTSLLSLAEENQGAVVPGYTHLNRAQPVLFSHLVVSYIEMLERDWGRLNDASKRLDVSVMGSGAIAGSALKLDRKFVCSQLGFKEVSRNSIDAVSDRDFMAEVLFALSMVAVHLSRIAEDFILYSTLEFGFIDLGDEFCTGSSLMPQKKNPDVLELVRGKSSIVLGGLTSLMVLLKGLPHSYNRDLQDDKKPLFEAAELISEELAIMASLVKTIQVKKETASKAVEDEFLYATDLAEYLVGKGVSFADAHEIVGKIVKHCAEKNINISDLSVAELKGFSEELDEEIFSLLNAGNSIAGKKTEGSTNPDMVRKEIAEWKKKLR